MFTHILGFPRIGNNRQLKTALESYWKGETKLSDLNRTAENIKLTNFEIQKNAGLSVVTVGDFSFYDRMLDIALMLGAIPERFVNKRLILKDTYFSMARGDALNNILPLPMKKWFNTNYHYIMPEIPNRLRPEYAHESITADARLAFDNGFVPKAAFIGPATFIALAAAAGHKWKISDAITEAYCRMISNLSEYCEWIQIEEPVLCRETDRQFEEIFLKMHKKIRQSTDLKLMMTTYFGDPSENLDLIAATEYDAVHIDYTSCDISSSLLAAKLPSEMFVSAGIVNGRNIWKSDTGKTADILYKLCGAIGAEKVMASSGCSLLHCPLDLSLENNLPESIRSRMAFAIQKCSEVAEAPSAKPKPTESKQFKSTLQPLPEELYKRMVPYAERAVKQKEKLNLPILPTTTIGSFPQTEHLRSVRKSLKNGNITEYQYENYIRLEIKNNIEKQEKLGLDVLVHGEPERNDMVEYFAEQLNGFCFTENGWVQSYGSRCVKPPVIHGDISADKPITLKWITFAASLTDKPVKAILTGPTTMLNWSFVREDADKEEIMTQLALVLRNEIKMLEDAGISIIQIDEAAFAEGMPPGRDEKKKYLAGAVRAFRLASSGVRNSTQIHTHMCYSEFDDLISYIADMDADVISIEAGRSGMTLLNSFKKNEYANEVGPGVYDIHSPRIPSVAEMAYSIKKMMNCIPPERLWINPDCGLKTRGWAETFSSLENMTAAAKLARESIKKQKKEKLLI